ncbi:type IV toxin-antitoxin system AbiEi family antitoxin [bacterium]|nr:type IV toxin-antitoxin system AbiEi family antitoxin [bacterium]
MSIQNREKLNNLQLLLPEGAMVSSKWLQNKGYSRQLLHKYVKNGWLKLVGNGAYTRQTTEVTWQGLVASLQHVNDDKNLHIGAETALNLHGYSHYLRLKGEKQIFVFIDSNIPAWIKNVLPNDYLKFMRKNLFSKTKNRLGLVTISSPIKNWSLTISTAERAIMEMLLLVVTKDISFTFAAELMESLTTLRPKTVNELLLNCKHIGVKRLFMFLAEYYNQPWVKQIKNTSFNLGTGKRMIVKGGKLDKKYLITVPKEFYDRTRESIL